MEWEQLDLDAGIVEGAVQPAVVTDDRLHQCLDLVGADHVATDKDRLAAGGANAVYHRLPTGLVNIGHHHSGTLRGKRVCRGLADACSPPGNQCDLATECHAHVYQLLTVLTHQGR